MISNKKAYAMKMLQLALALSLLHVDPDSLLQQRLRRWDDQLEVTQGVGSWELEILRSVPLVETQDPYGNRKGIPPVIAELLRYDDLPPSYKLSKSFNASAVVMNLHNTTGNSSVQTAALQDMQSTAGGATGNAVGGGGATAAGGGSSASSAGNELHIDTSSIATGSIALTPTPELDIFLSPDLLQDERSIWEQNLADLQDYGDFTVSSPYAGLPLKDGQQQNNTHLDLSLAALLQVGMQQQEQRREGATALNDSTPHPSSSASVTANQFDEDADDLFGHSPNLAICSSLVNACEAEGVHPSDTEGAIGPAAGTEEQPELEDNGFANEVEVVYEEESEIAEVLYKQDVDLGFSLNQEDIINASYARSNPSADAAKTLTDNAKNSDDNECASSSSSSASTDDTEKLKALEELQQDKPKVDDKSTNPLEDITNEWDGIPFTIDNETGEYIRLPLDELIDDVLRLSELPLEEEDLNSDSIASTSQAAAALNNNNIPSVVQTEKDNSENSAVNSEPSINDSKDDSNSIGDEDSDDDTFSIGFGLDEETKKELDEMLQSTAPPYHHHPHHHHQIAHHAAAAAAAHHHHHQRAVQAGPNYASVGSGANSAFHRQTSASGFHHGPHQSRMPPLNRMERLQDIATFLAPIPSMEMPPYPHYPSYSYQGPGAAMPPTQQYGHGVAPPPHHGHHAAMLHATNSALGDICSAAGAPQPHYGHNLGSAVSSSMHLTNSSHDADGAASAAAGNPYKMEHDMMYYSNASSDMNHTTDGFINSFLNDEDLHLMDMNESFCRIVDNSTSNNSSVLGLPSGATSGHGSHSSGGAGSLVPGASGNHAAVGASAGLPMSGAAGGAAVGMTADLLPSGGGGAQAGADRLDASSDSAVSSMGSERVPSLSDGEWGEGSDSAQDYHHGKYGGPYDFSYNNTTRISAATRQPPVAQKKHQLYGKRDPHKQLPSAMPTAAPPPGATAPPLPPTAQASAVQCQAQAQVQSIKYEYDAGYAGMASGPVPLQLSSSEPGAMGPSLSKDYPHHQGYGMGGAYSVDYTVRPPRTPQEIVTHNHTYSLPQGTGSQPRPQARDKKTPHGGAATKHTSSKAGGSSASSLSEEEHLTRDEKRARALNIPIPVSDIINLPMDEFNERLSKYDLSENQLSLIRDIRRRGKNKVAAQNCRKRKLDQILTLEDEVNRVVKRKAHLTQEHDSLDAERKRISNKFACLHRHVFQYLRDPEGNPCSPTDYSLQQAADGSVYLLPRDKSDSNSTGTTASSAVASSGSSNLNGHAHNGIAPTQASLHNHLAPAPQLHQASPHVAAMSQQQQLQLQQQQQLHQQQQQQLQQQQQAQNQQQPQHPHHTTQHKE